MPDSPISDPINEHDDSSDAPVQKLEVVLNKLPVGWFHYRLLLICGLSFMADGMEVSLLSFISTCAGIDWDLSGTQIALITSVVFAGELFGSICFGPIADSHGRRLAFMICTYLTARFVTATLYPHSRRLCDNYHCGISKWNIS